MSRKPKTLPVEIPPKPNDLSFANCSEKEWQKKYLAGYQELQKWKEALLPPSLVTKARSAVAADATGRPPLPIRRVPLPLVRNERLLILERIQDGIVAGAPPIDVRAIPEKLFVLSDVHATIEYGETCKLWIDTRKPLPKSARKGLLRYGFGEGFVERFLAFRQERPITEHPTHDLIENWFEFLYSLTGKRLKTALGEELVKKYSGYLRRNKVGWDAGCLSDLYIVWIVGVVLKLRAISESPRHHSLAVRQKNTNVAINMALRRWKYKRFTRRV